MSKHKYSPVSAASIPSGVRFDVPRRNQGQHVEVAFGGFSRAEHDEGDMFRRVTDHATRAVTYGKLVEDEG